MSEEIKNQIVTDPTGRAVAANIERLRAMKRMSRTDLSKTLEANGVKMTAHALGRVERLQRRIELGELTAIAFALEAKLSDLFMPDREDLDVAFGEASGLTGVPDHFSARDVEGWLKGEYGILDHEVIGTLWLERASRAEASVQRARDLLDDGESFESVEPLLNRWVDEFERAQGEALRHYRAAGVLDEGQGLDAIPPRRFLRSGEDGR